MKIHLVAQTQLMPDAFMPIKGTAFEAREDGNSTASDELAEFAGRACYQAWELPNPKTAENAGYLNNILTQQHESVLEHAQVTFYIEGVSRSLTHELIRHRHLSFSELSQRYVDMREATFVAPPGFVEAATAHGVTDARERFDNDELLNKLRDAYDEGVEFMTDNGFSRKQAREAARSVMPNATETKIVVSGNMRTWRDVLRKRYHVAADAEIREFATRVLAELRKVAPNSFQDFPDEPFGSDEK